MGFTRGKQIKIATIVEFNGTTITPLTINPKPLQGRPVKVLKWFVDLGFDRQWFTEKIFEDLIVFGWDRGYLKSDSGILALPFKYFLKDMDFSKKERLKELDGNEL